MFSLKTQRTSLTFWKNTVLRKEFVIAVKVIFRTGYFFSNSIGWGGGVKLTLRRIKKCPCLHNNNTAVITKIPFDTALVMTKT